MIIIHPPNNHNNNSSNNKLIKHNKLKIILNSKIYYDSQIKHLKQ